MEIYTGFLILISHYHYCQQYSQILVSPTCLCQLEYAWVIGANKINNWNFLSAALLLDYNFHISHASFCYLLISKILSGHKIKIGIFSLKPIISFYILL
jgi:hypothetical protein